MTTGLAVNRGFGCRFPCQLPALAKNLPPRGLWETFSKARWYLDTPRKVCFACGSSDHGPIIRAIRHIWLFAGRRLLTEKSHYAIQ